MTDDATLLRQYAQNDSHAAFAELVHRHLSLVYSAALRRLNGDVHDATEVTQLVFIRLARNAARLSRHAAITGWLYTATRNAALDLIRGNTRRLIRETEAHAMNELHEGSESSANWERLRPVIDEALDEIPRRDRELVLLRFFQNRSFPEIGAALHLTDDAARKRVERGLDRLRDGLSRRGITSTSAALGALLGVESSVAAPVELATSVISSAAAGAHTAAAVIGFMTLTKLQTGMIAALLVSGAIGISWQQHAIAKLRSEVVAANRRADEQIAALRAAKPAATSEPPAAPRPTIVESPPQPENRSVPALVAHGGEIAISPRQPASPASAQQIAALHKRYDSFLQQRGLTAPQIERWIELMAEKDNIRGDLQHAAREYGVNAGSKEFDALYAKATGPLWQQMRDILGPDGFTAFGEYERASAFQGYADALAPRLTAIGAPLTGTQSDALIRLIIANNHPVRLNPTDVGLTRVIDWKTVAQQAAAFLDPAQQSVLDDFAARQR